MRIQKKTAGIIAAAALAASGIGVVAAQPAGATPKGSVETLATADPFVVIGSAFGISPAQLRIDVTVKHMSAEQIAAQHNIPRATMIRKLNALADHYILDQDRATIHAMIAANVSKHL